MNFQQWLENDEEYETFGDVKEWHVGQLAILDEAGFTDIAICKIVPFEEVAEHGGDNFEMVDKNTIYLHNPFGGMEYKRGQSVPLRAIDYFGFHAKRATESHNGYHFVGAQNLYRTIDALVKNKLGHLYPDLAVQYYSSQQFNDLVRKYPTLKEKKSFLDEIEYQVFDVQGYSVIICPEKWAAARAKEYRSTGYTHPIGTYYFYVCKLDARSPSIALSKDKKMLKALNFPDNGLFNSMKDALAGAEKYIDYLFYSE